MITSLIVPTFRDYSSDAISLLSDAENHLSLKSYQGSFSPCTNFGFEFKNRYITKTDLFYVV